MSFALYAATALALLLLTDRFVTPITWRWRAVLFALPLVFVGPALLTNRVYGPVDLPYGVPPLAGLKQEFGIGEPHNILLGDVYTEILPWRQAVRSAIAAGRWPTWNPHVLSGEVLAAAAQPAAYSPFTLVALLIPAAKSFSYSAATTLFLAGLSAFLFALELKCREGASVIAAAGWMYATSVAFFVLWPLGASWALLPAALLATRRAVAMPGLRSAALFTTTFALLVLQGHPETTFHVCAIAAAWFAFCLASNRANAVKAISTAAAGAVVASMLCAVYLLPLLGAIPQTREHAYRTAVWAVQSRGIPIERGLARVATDFFPILHARKWASPAVGQVNLDTMAVGSILIAAALFGIGRMRNRDVLFFTLVLLFSLAAQMEQTSFERVLQHLPGFNVALNSRFTFAGAFCLVMLATLGVEGELVWRRAPRPLVVGGRDNGNHTGLAMTATIVLIALTGATAWLLHAGVVVGDPFPWARWRMIGDLVPLAIACIVLWIPISSSRTASILLMLIVAQRWLCDGRIYPTIRAEAAYPHIPILDRIDRSAEPFRITGVGQAFPPGTSAFYGLEDVRGYEPMLLLGYVRTYPLWCAEQPVWFNRVDDLRRPFLSFLNVRYAIAAENTIVPDGWREIARDRGAALLENSHVLPRAFVPTVVRLGTTEDQAIFEMATESNFMNRAWIAADTHAHDRQNGPGAVRLRRIHDGYRLDVVMDHDGWVVLSEPAWNGWRAYVDGRAVGVQTANVGFLSVFVPAGSHGLRLVYRPTSFTTGRAISLLTLGALIVAGIARRVLTHQATTSAALLHRDRGRTLH